MPNWCNNKLIVLGPDEDIERFKEKATGSSPWHKEDGTEKNILNFHSLVPVPDEVIKAGYEQAGYEWERQNWGCKWGACHAGLVDGRKGHLEYTFETPWCPPIPFLEKLGREWPTLTFLLDYEEPGMSYKGIARVHGEIVEDHCFDL